MPPIAIHSVWRAAVATFLDSENKPGWPILSVIGKGGAFLNPNLLECPFDVTREVEVQLQAPSPRIQIALNASDINSSSRDWTECHDPV
jgi:hypothetical protein